jgi:hypothetical protein
MEKLNIEAGPKTILEHDRQKYQEELLRRISEISGLMADSSAKLQSGNLKLEVPVQEELQAQISEDLAELRGSRKDLEDDLAA